MMQKIREHSHKECYIETTVKPTLLDKITGPFSTSKNNFSSALLTLFDTSRKCPTYDTMK